MYAVYLEHAGFHVQVAPDGEAGLQMAQNEPFDVIVMDLSMPKMDGWEATRPLKADNRTRHRSAKLEGGAPAPPMILPTPSAGPHAAPPAPRPRPGGPTRPP